MLDGRETLREALRLTLIKDRRDDEVFDELFTVFFSLRRVAPRGERDEPGHAHDDLADTAQLTSLTVTEELTDNPQQGHSHGKPADIRDFFDTRDLARQYNLHQEANKLDLAAMTDKIVLSKDGTPGRTEGIPSVQIETERLHNAGTPGQLAPLTGSRLSTELTVAQEQALLGWLEEATDELDELALATLRSQLAGIIDDLPALLKRHLDRLAELQAMTVESRLADRARIETVNEEERRQLEETLRRLTHSLHGALTSRKRNTPRGRVHSGRTMRHNMRYEGIPFRPVTITRAQDKPRLVVLADVSLSVRATARFTLHLVHGLQSLFAQVRSFVFVGEPIDISELFDEYPLERALGLIFDGLPAGGLLDVDGNSDYGRTFEALLADYGSILHRRTTVIVLGDARGNGNDAGLEAFEEITRKVGQMIWLTPEPRRTWRLGSCDLPRYAQFCDRLEVVADLAGLEHTAQQMSVAVTGR
jgi:uncharacterized protein with von Willebrand factor type A (vWA) domain